MLLMLVCTRHERDLELVPELIWLVDVLIAFEARGFSAVRLQQLLEVITTHKILLVK